jgi:hypothetical protein
MTKRLLRPAIAALALACALPAAALVLAGPAAAICDPDQCQPPPPPEHTYSATLTIAPPARGLVTGTAADGTVVLACGTGSIVLWPGTPPYPVTYTNCSLTDSQTTYSLIYPTTDWPSYTLSWQPTQFSTADGYVATWNGGCSGSATAPCGVVNGAPSTNVGVTLTDVQPPSVAFTLGSRVARGSQLSAYTSDNSGDSVTTSWSIAHVAPDGTATTVQTGAGQTVTLGDLPAGQLRVSVRATDPSGNVRMSSQTTTFVTSLTVTSQPLPALARSVELDFGSDDEDYVPNDAAHRQCRAYPTGGTAGAWGACTTATTFAPSLADGDWTLQAQETDSFGYSGLTTQTTTIDATAPVVAITSGPAEGATVRYATTAVGFTITEAHPANVTCALDAGAAVACTSPFTARGYHNGAHSVTITATDALGNATTVVRHFTAAVTTTLTPRTTNATVTVSYGHAARLSVAVRPASATGTVRFVNSANGALLCKATVSAGVATCSTSPTLSVGTRAVTASYSGGYSPSSTALTLVVTKAATKVRVASTVSAHHGSSVTVHAYGLPSGAKGTVSVYRGTTRLCQAAVSGGGAYCTFVAPATGSYPLSVRYSGDSHYRASSASTTLAVS